jgi:membrane-associated protease RseP (regulator of RpoE activity)
VPPRPRWALSLALLVTTFLTTTTLGAVWSVYSRLDVMVDPTRIATWLSPTVVVAVWSQREWLGLGLRFSLPLLFILLSHELGHYLTCRRYRVSATLPYFVPAPIALGTLGAFIRIRSVVPDKRKLFDIAIAGPIAGFVALLPVLVYGIAKSPAVAATTGPSGIAQLPGHSLTMLAVTRLVHGELPAGVILNLHPCVLAAWVGLLATSLNLLPVGQLDGGHILYALVGGRRHRQIAFVAWMVVVLGGYYFLGWLLWAAAILVIGLGHPPTRDDRERLDRPRQTLALLAVLILLLSVMPVPIRAVPVGEAAAAGIDGQDRERAPANRSARGLHQVKDPKATR